MKRNWTRYRIEYEFEYQVVGGGYSVQQDIIDCIEEDAKEAITQAIADITDEVQETTYRVVKL